jgi:hypothetical protein
MKKNTSLFLEKAKQYLATIEELLPQYDSLRGWSSSSFTKETDDEKKLKKTVFGVKLKIKLLFSEYENGSIFIDKLSEFEGKGSGFELLSRLNGNCDLDPYKDLLLLFIDHLENFVEVLEVETA